MFVLSDAGGPFGFTADEGENVGERVPAGSLGVNPSLVDLIRTHLVKAAEHGTQQVDEHQEDDGPRVFFRHLNKSRLLYPGVKSYYD